MARLTKAEQAEQAEQIAQLRELLPPGSTVFTVLRHVSRSGMRRHIDVYKLTEEGPLYLSYGVGLATETRQADDGALKVDGCGMDMGFHLVYNLSSVLYRDGFECIGERCPSNDHSNGDRDYTPHHHSSGGYALRHRWL